MLRVVSPALFWCAGSWNLRKDQLGKLRGMQYSCVRKMLSLSRETSESLADFMSRSNGIIRNLLNHHKVERWDLSSHRHVFSLAGWIARLRLHDPSRLTLHVLKYKDWSYLCQIAAENHGSQLHGRRLRIWRWERPLYTYDPDWQALAQDQTRGHAMITDMVVWRSVHR